MAVEARKDVGADSLFVEDLLSEEEVIPIMAGCWEKAEFPYHLLPKIVGLGICGDTIKGMLRALRPERLPRKSIL